MTKAKINMIITIVQAEIETAIRNYINEQINIREGQSVAIELQATRGAEGFRAVIDITTTAGPPKSPYPVVLPQAQAAAVAQTVANRVPQTPAEARQLMESQYEAEENQLTASVANDIVAEVAAEIAVELAASNESVSDAPVTKPQSLFKGLRKPVNA